MANQKRNLKSYERSKSVKSTSEMNRKKKNNQTEEPIQEFEDDSDEDFDDEDDSDEDFDDEDFDDEDDSDEDFDDEDDSDDADDADDYDDADDSDDDSDAEEPLLISSLMSSPEVPVGNYNAVIVDISTERQTGKYGPFYFLDVYLELETKKGTLPVKDRMTINLKEGAKLNKLLAALLGRVPKADYNLRKIIGEEVGVRITHRQDAEGRLWPEVEYLNSSVTI